MFALTPGAARQATEAGSLDVAVTPTHGILHAGRERLARR